MRYSMRHRGAALAVVVLLAAGCGGDSGTDGDASAFEPGTVTVSISGIDNAAGTYLAGVLYQSELTANSAVGGFGVEVDSDSFATSQVVRGPGPESEPDDDNALFPYVSDKPLIVEADNHFLQLWFAPSKMGLYSRWAPAASEGLGGCVMQFSLEPGTAVHVSVTGVPSPDTEVTLTCPDVSWEMIPSSEAISPPSPLQEQAAWKIALDDEGPGIHTVFMITTFPLREADVQGVGGRLVWEDTEVELCRIGIRSAGDGFVRIGDIFQTTEGCGTNTGMQQAFDDHGLPETACVYVRADGVDDEYCAALAID